MRRVLFDVNVVLDVLLNRRPYVEASAAVFGAAEQGNTQGWLSAHAVTTIHYLIRREMNTAQTKPLLQAMLAVLAVAPVDSAVVQEALPLSWPDFEDAVTAAAARRAGCDYIVTRGPAGFRGSPVKPITPEALAAILAERG